jgi:hypothetical protein
MRFIRDDKKGYRLDDYLAYLREQGDKLPSGVREFACATWHYDITHHQCPHDSWLEHYVVREISSGARDHIRSTEITARFLNAYHDGHFDLVYHGVSSYALELSECRADQTIRGHGDWLIDEITVSTSNEVTHSIEFSAARWTVRCADLRYTWMPITH